MNYASGICALCGLRMSEHKSITLNCPKSGRIERDKFLGQHWDTERFTDSGTKMVNEAAPELLEALEESTKEMKMLIDLIKALPVEEKSGFRAEAVIIRHNKLINRVKGK